MTNAVTMNTPSILVTGATGYLGRHLLRALRHQGASEPQSVAILVRNQQAWDAQSWRDEAGPVTVIEGDPVQPEIWQNNPRLSQIKTIFHVAAVVKHSRIAVEEMMTFNINSTVQMVRAAKHIGAKLVFVSSAGTVGCFHSFDTVADEGAPYAEALIKDWPYYTSKMHAEQHASALADKLGLPFIIVRPPVLLGPDDHRFRSTGHISRVLEKKLPFIPKGSLQIADVRDVANAMARIAILDRPRSIYHLPGTTLQMRDFFQLVSDISNVPIPKWTPPNWMLKNAAAIMNRLNRMAGDSPSKLTAGLPDPVVLEMCMFHWNITSRWSAQELHYTPRPCRQTIVDTVAWLREHKSDTHSHTHPRPTIMQPVTE